MDLDATQPIYFDEYDEPDETEQDKSRSKKLVAHLKVFRHHDVEERLFEIYEGNNFIGRDEKCEITIPQKSLSKMHACIEAHGELHLIYDNSSKNRTRRDKLVLKPEVRYELKTGDMLILADVTCQYLKGNKNQDDNDTGSETGSESMLPTDSDAHNTGDDKGLESVYAADTESDTDDEGQATKAKAAFLYSSEEEQIKHAGKEGLPPAALYSTDDSDQHRPVVPALLYDSDEETSATRTAGQTTVYDSSTDDDESACPSRNKHYTTTEGQTLAYGLATPEDMTVIRPTPRKPVEGTPLTLVYSSDSPERTPDRFSTNITGQQKGGKATDSPSCEPTLVYGSTSPHDSPQHHAEESSRLYQKETLPSCEPTMIYGSHSLKHSQHESPEKDAPLQSFCEPTMILDAGTLKETPTKDVPSDTHHSCEPTMIYASDIQGHSPTSGDPLVSEPTLAYASPESSPAGPPQAPDSEEEKEEREDTGSPNLEKTLPYYDGATQAYTLDENETDDEDDDLAFQATQAYFMSEPDKQNEESSDDHKQESTVTNEPQDIEATVPYGYTSPADGDPTVPYGGDMETQDYNVEASAGIDTGTSSFQVDSSNNREETGLGEDVTDVEATVPEMETQMYGEEDSKERSEDRDLVSKGKQDQAASPVDKGMELQPTVPYNIEMETQPYGADDATDVDDDDMNGSVVKSNKQETPEVQDTVIREIPPIVKYSIVAETQDYGAESDHNDDVDSQDNGAGKRDKRGENTDNQATLAYDLGETQAYGVDEPTLAYKLADVEESKDLDDDDEGICATQAYGVEEPTIPYGLEDSEEQGVVSTDNKESKAASKQIVPDSQDAGSLSPVIPFRGARESETTNQTTWRTRKGETRTATFVSRNSQETTEADECDTDSVSAKPKEQSRQQVSRLTNVPPEDSEEEFRGRKPRARRGKKGSTSLVTDEPPQETKSRGAASRRSRGKTAMHSDEKDEESAVSRRETVRRGQDHEDKEVEKPNQEQETELQIVSSVKSKGKGKGKGKKTQSKDSELLEQVSTDARHGEDDKATLVLKPSSSRRGRGRVTQDKDDQPELVDEIGSKTRKTPNRRTRGKAAMHVGEEEEVVMVRDRTRQSEKGTGEQQETEVIPVAEKPDEQEHSSVLKGKGKRKGRKSNVKASGRTGSTTSDKETSEVSTGVLAKGPSTRKGRGRKSQDLEEKKIPVSLDQTSSALSQDDSDDLPSLATILSTRRGRGRARQQIENRDPVEQDVKVLNRLDDKEGSPAFITPVKPTATRKRGRGSKVEDKEESPIPSSVHGSDVFGSEEVEATPVIKPVFSRRGRGRVTQPATEIEVPEPFEEEPAAAATETQAIVKTLSTRRSGRRGRAAKNEVELRDSSETVDLSETISESQSSIVSSTASTGRGKGRGRRGKTEPKVPESPSALDQSEQAMEYLESAASSSADTGRARGGRGKKRETQDFQEVQATPAKKGRRKELPSPAQSPSLRERKPADDKPRVMFTGLVDQQGEKVVSSLGGTLVDSVYDCTHLVTDKVRRTVKFLCGVASGQVIIQPSWLGACKKANAFVDPAPFLVNDKAAEKQYKFSLQRSHERALERGLLEGRKVHVTKSVKPEPAQMKDIIKCAKGEFLPRVSLAKDDGILVISCEEDYHACQPALQTGIPVYTAELILTGILRQELTLDENRLFEDETTGASDKPTHNKAESKKRKQDAAESTSVTPSTSARSSKRKKK